MPIQDNQTKQTLASMSWARLDWKQRVLNSQIRMYKDLSDTKTKHLTQYFYDGQNKNSLLITTKTLSQMEVVLCTFTK